MKRVEYFWAELRRRKTVRTAIAYIVLLIAVVGPASDISSGLGAPDWVLRYIIIGLFLGFPVVLVLSWLFDFSFSHGIERTPQKEDEISNEEDSGPESYTQEDHIDDLLDLDSALLNIPLDLSEKRQVSVFSCSITAYSNGEEDPELLIGFVDLIDEELTAIIERYDGEILIESRQKISISLGYPRLHEDDSHRTARAGREILSLVASRQEHEGTERSIVVRGGIHTEQIIIEKDSDEQQASTLLSDMVGVADFLAAMAPPNTIAISHASYQILRQFFLVEQFNLVSHPKLGESVPVYQLKKALPRQLQNIASQKTVVFGRESEQGLILQQWESVLDHESQFVLLKGEAGIGKSSLMTSSIKELLLNSEPQLVTLECEPYYQTSPLRPVISYLERTIFAEARYADDQEKLEHLKRFLTNLSLEQTEALPTLAALLSLKIDDESLAITDSSKVLREKTLALLVDLVRKGSAVQPVILIVEDIHWADSSTISLIEKFVTDAPDSRILGLITARLEFDSDWGDLSHVTEIKLNKLSSRTGVDLVKYNSNGKEIPPAIIDQILLESNGIPLYIEQLTRALIESGVDFTTSPVGKLEIPDSLSGSLAARIENLGDAKPLFQLCAVLGFEFPYLLLQEVSGVEDESLLKAALSQIVSKGLLYQKGVYPDASFKFQHRLFMDVASQTLLKSTRHKLHQLIAQVLEKSFPDICENRPTQLAYHYGKARNPEKAVFYWIKAAKRSQARFANEEVIQQVEQGLKHLEAIPDQEIANNFEITLQTLLGEAYLVSRGYTSKELQAAFERAVELTSRVKESSESFQVIVGLWMHYVIRGENQQALQLSRQLEAIATSIDKNQELLQAEYCTGFTLYYMGRIDEAIEHLDRAMSFIQPGSSYTRQSPSHDDTRIMLNNFVGLANWAKGEFALSREALDSAYQLATELNDPYGMVRALYYRAILALMNGEYEEAARNAAEFLDISKKKGFSFFVVMGMFISSFGVADEEERLEAAIKVMEMIIPTGARSGITFLIALIIEECIKQQKQEQAEKYIELAEKFATKQQERIYTSEILRLKALLLMQVDPGNRDQALKLLQEGIDLASELNNKPFALRCALSMADVTDSEDFALANLKKILDSCRDIPDTRDFARAEQLINESTSQESVAKL